MARESALLTEIEAAFGDTAKPVRFHPDDGDPECCEHEELLQSRTRETISRHDVRSSWDPLTGACPQGFAYYFPALARLAITPVGDAYDWYAEQMLFHLMHEGSNNPFLNHCTQEQRSAVASLLMFIWEERRVSVAQCCMEDELCDCIALWRKSE